VRARARNKDAQWHANGRIACMPSDDFHPLLLSFEDPNGSSFWCAECSSAFFAQLNRARAPAFGLGTNSHWKRQNMRFSRFNEETDCMGGG
jgi:hypothetical protein